MRTRRMHYLLENATDSGAPDVFVPISCIAHVVCGLSLRKVLLYCHCFFKYP